MNRTSPAQWPWPNNVRAAARSEPISTRSPEPASASTAEPGSSEQRDTRRVDRLSSRAPADRASREARTSRRHWHPAVPGLWAAVPAAVRPFGGGLC